MPLQKKIYTYLAMLLGCSTETSEPEGILLFPVFFQSIPKLKNQNQDILSRSFSPTEGDESY